MKIHNIGIITHIKYTNHADIGFTNIAIQDPLIIFFFDIESTVFFGILTFM